jgi:uncharacterized protein (DUF1800 family)
MPFNPRENVHFVTFRRMAAMNSSLAPAGAWGSNRRMDLTLRALNRFGLGARAAERGRIADPRGWLRTQLGGAAPGVTAPDIASPTAIAEALRAVRTAGQDQTKRQEARRRLVAIAVAESRACLTQRISTDRPFVERLVAFWSNHLCVSAAAKVQVAPLAGSYERDVIRPHALGRFEDLVLASARHPAMLIYLDNFQSIGPGSPGAKRARGARAQRGLNENYARELLELHTLGVDGGYAQQDVLELAKALTGWSIGGLNDGPDAAPMGRRRAAPSGTTARGDEAMSFAYRPLLHEPGARTILGKRYNDEGVGQGERIIRDLCRHTSTARFVATKLVRHFVSDTPPASAVDRVARVFRESEGDLRAVSGAVIDLPEAWSPDTRKFRTPQDWLVAVLRAFGQHEVDEREVAALRQLRHPLWAPAAPKGFGDSMQEWADPDSLLNRAELARTFTRRGTSGQTEPRTLLDVVDAAQSDPLRSLLADSSITAAERVALAIAGPDFQWR